MSGDAGEAIGVSERPWIDRVRNRGVESQCRNGRLRGVKDAEAIADGIVRGEAGEHKIVRARMGEGEGTYIRVSVIASQDRSGWRVKRCEDQEARENIFAIVINPLPVRGGDAVDIGAERG